MSIAITCELTRIKAGWAATGGGLAAHGPTPHIARANLVRTLGHFLEPFRRDGTLAAELESLGLVDDNCPEPPIVLIASEA